jgi:hypothetical protein
MTFAGRIDFLHIVEQMLFLLTSGLSFGEVASFSRNFCICAASFALMSSAVIATLHCVDEIDRDCGKLDGANAPAKEANDKAAIMVDVNFIFYFVCNEWR